MRKLDISPTGGTRSSVARDLQQTVSKWYQGLRIVALVGLLSVLIYVGIRILISSTGKEKAKYKQMIIDWIAAVCILFVLQYIMSFTMTMVDLILGIFKTNIVGENGQDILITTIRQNIGNHVSSYSLIFSDLIIYLVLVVYTCIFTVQYLKRVVYLAFFTMIAPLIALTYPLDKIKDGQAQAFNMWLREYVFNALLPVIHIVLYSIFVSSAMNFALSNPLYAIVCIGFLIPAEKFLRKLFGFEKASTASPLGAAAGGALAMSAFNKFRSMGSSGGKGGSGSSGGADAKKGVRTASTNPLSGLSGEPGSASSLYRNKRGKAVTPKPQLTGSGFNNVMRKRFGTKEAVKRNIKGIAKTGARFAGAVGGAVAGTMLGGLSGDLSGAAKYIAAGTGAGFMAGGGLVDKGFNAYDSVKTGIDNITYDAVEGRYGAEYAEQRKFDKEFYKSEEGKALEKEYGRDNVQEVLNAGISDQKDIANILKNANNSNMDIKKSIGYHQLANVSDSIVYDDKKFQQYLKDNNIKIDVPQKLQDRVHNAKQAFEQHQTEEAKENLKKVEKELSDNLSEQLKGFRQNRKKFT